jgi:hypothetical protein
MKRRLFLTLLPTLLLAPTGICSPPNPNFSGTWKQSNERCQPKRTGEVMLRIDHQGHRLTVETTILRESAQPRHAIQLYTTDGNVSVTTGADGDEFHTSVTWSGPTLVFAVEEHEDGRILLSKETWTLLENGGVLQRVRERSDGNEKQTLIYTR